MQYKLHRIFKFLNLSEQFTIESKSSKQKYVWKTPLMAFATATHLIWQVHPDDIYESDWIRDVFSNVKYEEIIDTKYEVLKDNAIVVVSSFAENKDEMNYFAKLTGHKDAINYFSKLSKNNFKYAVVVLGDEVYSVPTQYYEKAEFVLRNYWHKKFLDKKNVLSFPLGFKKGFWTTCKNQKTKEASLRTYSWSFIGQIQKSTRISMINSMKQVPNFHIYETSQFEDPKGLPIGDYRDILLDSIFVPCPRGWWNLDSYRLSETLECGCIPIVEKSPLNYFEKMFGPHPFLAVNSWEEAPEMINDLLANPARLEELRLECLQWWNTYKKSLQVDVAQLVEEKFDTKSKKDLTQRGIIDCLFLYNHSKQIDFSFVKKLESSKAI